MNETRSLPSSPKEPLISPSPTPVPSIAIDYVLPDGLPVLLRPVVPADRAALAQGFEKLTPKTRQLRFFRGMNSLSPEDLDYLTRVDQTNHIAWCVCDRSSADLPGLGLGRFIRPEPSSPWAEFALVVIDVYQRRLLGTLLLAALLLKAEEIGLHRLRAIVLNDNESALSWIKSLGAPLVHQDPMGATFDLPVAGQVPAFPKTKASVWIEQFRCDLRALQASVAHE